MRVKLNEEVVHAINALTMATTNKRVFQAVSDTTIKINIIKIDL